MIKKEARGFAKGDDLGEVQEIGQEFVVTERGRIKKTNSIYQNIWLKDMVATHYGLTLPRMRSKIISKKDRPPKEGEYSRYKTASITEQYDTTSSQTSSSSGKSQGNRYNVEERLPIIEKKIVLEILLLLEQNKHQEM